IEAESEFNPRAVSRRGARGLMQLMPKTAATLGVDDPFDPKANIEAGVKHLRAMMDRFDNNIPLALAAYNAGEVAVIKHRGIPPGSRGRWSAPGGWTGVPAPTHAAARSRSYRSAGRPRSTGLLTSFDASTTGAEARESMAARMAGAAPVASITRRASSIDF